MTNNDVFVCVRADLAIAYSIQSVTEVICVILSTHQELTTSMYHIRRQLETLTDTLLTLDYLQD